MPQPSCAQRVQHDARVVRVQQVVHGGRAARSAPPAAARGWRCSWSRAGAPCRRPPASGGMSRKAVANIGFSPDGAGAPMLPAGARRGWRRRSRASSACGVAGWPSCASSWPAAPRGRPATARSNSFAVGQQDVAPHRRVAGGDAGEVAKARAGQRQEVAGRRAAPAMPLMKAKASRCGRWLTAAKARVVRLGRHLQHLAAQRRSRPAWRAARCERSVALDRRQDHLRAGVQVGIGMLDARRPPCRRSGCAGTKRADLLAQAAPRGLDHVALGRADVHDQHVAA